MKFAAETKGQISLSEALDTDASIDVDAVRRGFDTLTVATCGNYGAAMALAAGAAGLRCVIFIPGSYQTRRVEQMAAHVAAVRRGAPEQFIVADLPFLAHRKGLGPAMEAVETLMKSGASAVKVEGIRGHEDVVRHIVESGVPVMGHLGLTPQSVNQLGGFKVQGRGENDRVVRRSRRTRLRVAEVDPKNWTAR